MSKSSSNPKLGAVINLANRWNIPVEDIATLFAVESSFRTDLVGGKNNQHQGLIQWGVRERMNELPIHMARIGLDPKTPILKVPFTEQVELVRLWVEQRARQRGITIRNIHDVYKIINPSAYSPNGDAFGTQGMQVFDPSSRKRKEAREWLSMNGYQPLQESPPPSPSSPQGVGIAATSPPSPLPSKNPTTTTAVASEINNHPQKTYALFQRNPETNALIPRGTIVFRSDHQVEEVRTTLYHQKPSNGRGSPAQEMLNHMTKNPDLYYVRLVGSSSPPQPLQQYLASNQTSFSTLSLSPLSVLSLAIIDSETQQPVAMNQQIKQEPQIESD